MLNSEIFSSVNVESFILKIYFFSRAQSMPVDFSQGRMCNLIQMGEVGSGAIRGSLHQ